VRKSFVRHSTLKKVCFFPSYNSTLFFIFPATFARPHWRKKVRPCFRLHHLILTSLSVRVRSVRSSLRCRVQPKPTRQMLLPQTHQRSKPCNTNKYITSLKPDSGVYTPLSWGPVWLQGIVSPLGMLSSISSKYTDRFRYQPVLPVRVLMHSGTPTPASVCPWRCVRFTRLRPPSPSSSISMSLGNPREHRFPTSGSLSALSPAQRLRSTSFGSSTTRSPSYTKLFMRSTIRRLAFAPSCLTASTYCDFVSFMTNNPLHHLSMFVVANSELAAWSAAYYRCLHDG
jgi:hypothetical protein